MTEFELNRVYEDRRTHRNGKLLEYNEKYKTYLLESSDGKSFNVTSSQFKNNWRMIEQEEVKEQIKPEVEQAEIKPARYKGKSEEEKKELNDLFSSSTIYINEYVQGFKNPHIQMNIRQPISKNTLRVRIDHWIVFDVQVMVKSKKCRIWLGEYAFNSTSWTVKPLAMKQYPGTNKNYTVEFSLEDLPTVLDDLKPAVLDKLAEIVGGIKDEI